MLPLPWLGRQTATLSCSHSVERQTTTTPHPPPRLHVNWFLKRILKTFRYKRFVKFPEPKFEKWSRHKRVGKICRYFPSVQFKFLTVHLIDIPRDPETERDINDYRLQLRHSGYRKLPHTSPGLYIFIGGFRQAYKRGGLYRTKKSAQTSYGSADRRKFCI